MAVDSLHPAYQAMIDRWLCLRHSYAGESTVKSNTTAYLPATTGMIADGYPKPNTKGHNAYSAYNTRAVFHNFVEMAVKDAMGKLHSKPATINLPEGLEGMRERATPDGDDLDLLHSKINEEQLKVGRCGIMLDLPATKVASNVPPGIALYTAEQIINWDNGAFDDPVMQNLNLVVLDESEWQRTDRFEWDYKTQYRVLWLGEIDANVERGNYSVAIVDDTAVDVSAVNTVEPNFKGNILKEIPFTFINTMDLLPSPSKPPLETLGNLGMTIYRGEADFRQALFMTGQDTLVLTGVSSDDSEVRVGAGAVIKLTNEQATAQYVGVAGVGLETMALALVNDKEAARHLAGQFVDRAQVESGDAIRRRLSAKHATLVDIALVGAGGLERALKQAARWGGFDESQVEVIPNLEFMDEGLQTELLTQFMAAKAQGLPLSLLSIWNMMKSKDFTEFETMEDELAQIEKEADFISSVPGGPGIEDDDDPDEDLENDDD